MALRLKIIDMGTPTVEMCDDCHHVSVVVASLVSFGPSGVSTVGTLRRCVECRPVEEDAD